MRHILLLVSWFIGDSLKYFTASHWAKKLTPHSYRLVPLADIRPDVQKISNILQGVALLDLRVMQLGTSQGGR